VISHHISAWHRTLFDPSAATSRPCSVQSHDGAGLGQRIRRSDAVVGDLVHRGIPGGVQGRDHQPFPNRWRRYRRRGMSRGQSCVAPTRDRRGGMVASTAWTSATRTHSCQQLGPVRSIPGGSGLDSPATPAGCDGCGHYRGVRDRRRPDLIAAATTAVFATGAPMTPTLPTPARLTGTFSLLRLQLQLLRPPRWRR
jgi:hypothetical protein